MAYCNVREPKEKLDHMPVNPDQAVQAFLDLRGKIYLPAHWGSFNLSTHNWYDPPIEGAIKYGEEKGIVLVSPYPGEIITVGETLPSRKRWKTAEPKVAR